MLSGRGVRLLRCHEERKKGQPRIETLALFTRRYHLRHGFRQNAQLKLGVERGIGRGRYQNTALIGRRCCRPKCSRSRKKRRREDDVLEIKPITKRILLVKKWPKIRIKAQSHVEQDRLLHEKGACTTRSATSSKAVISRRQFYRQRETPKRNEGRKNKRMERTK